MKIVADRNIPFLQGVFEPYAEVVYLDGKAISREDLMDADVLITRTRTRCNASLLEGTPVRMISTATIGTDHIDMAFCLENGIAVANAAGCNAGGVMDYVFSALYAIASRKSIRLQGKTFGVVGVGHVGSKVVDMARKLGFRVLQCDPPRERREGSAEFCSLDELLAESDIVSMHTPLDASTQQMCDADFFSKIKPDAIFINSSRGEVVDENALFHAVPKLGAVVIDTWCREPDVNPALLDAVDIATPHIAGYSYQGKQNGTALAVRSVARRFGIVPLMEFHPESDIPELQPIRLNVKGLGQGEIASVFQYNYPIFTDDFIFRLDPSRFEEIRSDYKYRREFYLED